MPGFDGTGPRGEGPMTGRGEGECAVVLPDSAPGAYANRVLPGPIPPLRSRRARMWAGRWLQRRRRWAGPGRGWGRGRGHRRW